VLQTNDLREAAVWLQVPSPGGLTLGLSRASSFLDLYIQFIKLGMFTTPPFENYFGD
jgi:hypothetical protein